jgi:RNA polymerase sigma factor (sigma-70 family)
MRYGKAGSMILAEENMNTGEAAATAAAAVTKAGPRVSWNINPTAWVDDHGDFLFRYALMRLRDETAAEDLVQETLLAAIQSLASYAGKSSERTWLTSILKHKIIDYYRRQARETTFGDSSAADADLSSFDRFFERATSGTDIGTRGSRRRRTGICRRKRRSNRASFSTCSKTASRNCPKKRPAFSPCARWTGWKAARFAR